MWDAIWVTLLIFGFLLSGIMLLKRSANSFKLPPNIKAQPYQDDDDDDDESEQQEIESTDNNKD